MQNETKQTKKQLEKDILGKDYGVCEKCGDYYLLGSPFNPDCHKCR